MALILLGIVSAPALLTTPIGQRGLMAMVIGTLLLLLVVKSPRVGVVLVLIYLSLLGGLRRWLIPAFGWTATDPLVLVQAAIIGLYFMSIVAKRRIDWDTRLARCLGCLLVLMALEVFNPLQGGLLVGLAGILLTMIPPLWYYAGRRLGTPQTVLNVIRAALVISLLAAVYGLYQAFVGFLPSEQQWMRINGVQDLRVFSVFTLMAEYGIFLSIGTSILWAAFLKGNRFAMLPLFLLAVAILFLGERGVIVTTLSICVALWAVQGRTFYAWLPRLLIAAVLATGGLVWSLQQAQHVDFGTKTQALVEHQTTGLLDPGHSTAASHASMMYGGVIEAVHSPLGHGLGSTTLAASKFGSGAVTTESDWSDEFVALGLAGGVLYSVIISLILFTAARQWMKTRSFVSLALSGILLAGVGHWLHGDFYAMSMLMWFLIGSVDRAERSSQVVSNLEKVAE